MWLDIVVLGSTLLIGLIGSVTSLTDSMPGKVLVAALLLISTGVSIWLKRAEQAKEEEIYSGVRDLTLRTPPSRESIDYVKTALIEYCRNEEGLHMNAVLHTSTNASIVYILFADPDPDSGLDPDDDEIDWQDYPELIYGAVAVDADDVRALSRLTSKRLTEVLRNEIVGSWETAYGATDRAYIDRRMLILVDAALTSQDLWFSCSTSAVYSRTSELTAIEVLPIRTDDRDSSVPELIFDETFLVGLTHESPLTRGKLIFQHVASWRSEFDSSASE